MFALSSVVGPTLGGWITDNLDWRWVFYINIPLGIFSLIALPFVLPQSATRREAKIDYLGAVTITSSVVALLLALSWVGEGYDWDATRVVWGFIVSAVLLAGFIPIELRAPEPIIPLSLFKSRVFAMGSALMFLVGIGMFGIILYTPLFVQGVLGESATGSGTVLTPLVFSMTFVSIVGGQIIARVKRVKPFTLFGTVVMACGVYLLTTLGVDSTLGTVAIYLMVTGFGLGLIMPTVTLAIQTTVDKSLLGVATSATQFIRSLGSTVGTAVIGSLVTKGYADSLRADAPPQAPGRLISALENPQALVSDEARAALSRAASAFPGGEQVVDSVVQVARESLSGSIHDGFIFIFGAVCIAVVAAVLMKGVRLEEKPVVAAEPVLDPNDSAALTARLAEALRKDPVHGSTDEAFVALVSSVDGADTPLERERASAALSGLAQRIESGNGDYPALVHAAAELANGQEGDERERAVHVSKTVIRPLAEDLGALDHIGA